LRTKVNKKLSHHRWDKLSSYIILYCQIVKILYIYNDLSLNSNVTYPLQISHQWHIGTRGTPNTYRTLAAKWLPFWHLFYLFIFLCLSPPFGAVKTFPSPTSSTYAFSDRKSDKFNTRVKNIKWSGKMKAKKKLIKKLEFSSKNSFWQNWFSYFIISNIHKNIIVQHSIHKSVKCILYY